MLRARFYWPDEFRKKFIGVEFGTADAGGKRPANFREVGGSTTWPATLFGAAKEDGRRAEICRRFTEIKRTTKAGKA